MARTIILASMLIGALCVPACLHAQEISILQTIRDQQWRDPGGSPWVSAKTSEPAPGQTVAKVVPPTEIPRRLPDGRIIAALFGVGVGVAIWLRKAPKPEYPLGTRR